MADKLALIVTSGSREQLQMAAMMASVGAVSGTEVTVFLSMNAMTYFIHGREREEAPNAGEMGALLAEKKAPHFMELFQQAADLGGAKIHPCSMAVDVLGVRAEDLNPMLEPPLGLTKFMSDFQDATVLTF
ncbi:DsrE/DsrF/DrsH-like family protein [Thiohalorhabdus sp. Cl-TMA]|uniref:DsrE/DsrF/DrsH-like family protein n=1 Tax=Thiohalorhabdus methylotrophus TaxID=3242694 RepID=A0ABV4TZ09_9GAMM